MKTEINQINEKLKNLYSYHKPHLEVKMTNDIEELKKAKQLRQKYYQSFQTHNEQINQTHTRAPLEQNSVVYDGYDSFAEHLIVIDHKQNKIIAYVRLIDSYVAYKIGGYYSETQFNLSSLVNHSAHYLEMSRLVIDPEYNFKETAQLLWSALINYSNINGVDSLIGTFTLPMTEPQDTFSYIQYLKDNHSSHHQHRVYPYQSLPVNKFSKNNNYAHPLIDYFFENGTKLCGDANWNNNSNCAEIFIQYPINIKPMTPHYIQMGYDTDELDSGVDFIN